MSINLTEIIVALIGLCGTIITVVVVPYVRGKMGDEQWKKMKELIEVGVAAAEQLSMTGVITKDDRKQYVVDSINKSGIIERMKKLGINIDIEEIYDLIEASVYNLPNKLTNTQYQKIAEQKVEVMAETAIETQVAVRVDEIMATKMYVNERDNDKTMEDVNE